MEARVEKPPEAAKSKGPLYIEDLNVLLNPKECPAQESFLLRTKRLIDVVRSGGSCGSEIINEVKDPAVVLERQGLIRELWQQREANDIGGILDSRLFAEMTVRVLDIEEAPIPCGFFSEFGELIVKPALASTGQSHLLEQEWTPQLLEFRTKFLCMVQPIKRHIGLLETVRPLGPAYGIYVSPALAIVFNAVKPILTSLSDKETKLSVLAEVEAMIESEDVSKGSDEAKSIAAPYLSLLWDMPTNLTDAAEHDDTLREFLQGADMKELVAHAKAFVLSATKGISGAVAGGRL